MNSEELKTQLVRETQAKNQSVELVRTALLNTAETFRKELSESASNLRQDFRDETKSYREELSKIQENERAKWSQQLTSANEELNKVRRKLWTWGPIAMLATVFITVGLTVALTWWLTSRGTGLALTNLQQAQATNLADLRGQVETERGKLAELKKSIQEANTKLKTLQEASAGEKAAYDQWKASNQFAPMLERLSVYRLTDNQGRLTENYAAVVPDEAKPWKTQKGEWVIEVKLKN